jgi:hypothetical protein
VGGEGTNDGSVYKKKEINKTKKEERTEGEIKRDKERENERR